MAPKRQAETRALRADYVVVGAGSAGCVVANKLSEDGKNTVLVVEAGGLDNWIWFHIPVGYLFAIGNPRADWMYRTESEAGLNGRSLAYPRGKVLGGSSAINAMISMRGQAADYDGWRALGLNGWGWTDVLPIFREIEDHFLGASDVHGVGGPWKVNAPRVRWEVLDAVADAAEQMGVPRTPDFNSGDNFGVGYFHVNQSSGLRWSAAKAFLKPALKRPNLELMTKTEVAQVNFEDGAARSVECRRGDQRLSILANREIILCAGSIGSPRILQSSGIGPAEWLKDVGIEVKWHLPGVGRNLQDHLQQRAIFKVFGTKTLNERYHNVMSRAFMGFEYAMFRTGPLTMAPSQLGLFCHSRLDPGARPNIEFHIQPLSLDKFGEPLHPFPAITVSACNLRPTSRGTIRIASGDPLASPHISPNYLSTSDDRQVAADAIRVTRRLMAQQALRRFSPAEFLPGPAVGDGDEELSHAAGDIGTTIFHPVGTARMGPSGDPMAVVDAHGKLQGIERLRVVDASIMPLITSGNTNTPTIMMAAKISSEMIGDG